LDDTLGAAWVKPGWPPELRADAWAGCVLAKLDLGARGLDPALRALEKYPAPSHPAWGVRLPVLRTGFTQCGGTGSNLGAPEGSPVPLCRTLTGPANHLPAPSPAAILSGTWNITHGTRWTRKS